MKEATEFTNAANRTAMVALTLDKEQEFVAAANAWPGQVHPEVS